MTDLTTTRTPEVIAAEVRALTATVLTNVIEIGRRFAEAKALLPHGEFGAWLENSTGYSQRTANNFMRLFDAYGDQQASMFGANPNSQAFANLPYTKALALLSVPEEEREDFAREVDAESISLRDLQEKIKERDQQLADSETALAEVKDNYEDAVDRNKRLARRVAELEEQSNQQLQEIAEMAARPTDVAVREPTAEELDAIVADRLRESDRIHAENLANADKERRKVEAALGDERLKVKRLQEKLKAAQDEHEKAVEAAKGEGKKDAAEKIAELKQALAVAQSDVRTLTDQKEALERSATLAQEPVITFRACFGQWQKAHKDMLDALERAAQEPAAKLKAAMKAQLEAWLKEV